MGKVKKITFYKCTSMDLRRIIDLARAIWPSTFKDILSPEQLAYMLNWMYNSEELQAQKTKGHLFYLVLDNGRDIGFVGLEPHYPETGTLRIHKVYLLPEYQGQGIGKWMLNEIETIARERKLIALNLNVNRYNKATEFYKKLNFEIVQSEDIDIGNGFFMNDYVMTKKLS